MLWIKSLHIISMVSWFAGLFYLPRIFVYHAGHPDGPVHEQFCVMERKLYRFIMRPAMMATIFFGMWLAWIEWEIVYDTVWFWSKMTLVAILLGFHIHNGRVVADFAAGRNHRPHTFYRMYNEIPTLILIVVVMLVVVRPF
ncbi:MAG TPA: protoporphyrinogen oxidase HemJ [Mariprofundaceae bacterium]|nr:protoporphyrinogen oxidase HemJ [Mariprofundaceae bacterium]